MRLNFFLGKFDNKLWDEPSFKSFKSSKYKYSKYN